MRVEHVGIARDDEFYRLVSEASAAATGLITDVHKRACRLEYWRGYNGGNGNRADEKAPLVPLPSANALGTNYRRGHRAWLGDERAP